MADGFAPPPALVVRRCAGSVRRMLPKAPPRGVSTADGTECLLGARLYYVRRDWVSNFDAARSDARCDDYGGTAHGMLGRCVYRCDNDVVDHQLLMEMDDEVTMSLRWRCLLTTISARPYIH
ncbi:MAG: hypothetical protein ACLRMJ_11645 [Alistipes finegoldii]